MPIEVAWCGERSRRRARPMFDDRLCLRVDNPDQGNTRREVILQLLMGGAGLVVRREHFDNHIRCDLGKPVALLYCREPFFVA